MPAAPARNRRVPSSPPARPLRGWAARSPREKNRGRDTTFQHTRALTLTLCSGAGGGAGPGESMQTPLSWAPWSRPADGKGGFQRQRMLRTCLSPWCSRTGLGTQDPARQTFRIRDTKRASGCASSLSPHFPKRDPRSDRFPPLALFVEQECGLNPGSRQLTSLVRRPDAEAGNTVL